MEPASVNDIFREALFIIVQMVAVIITPSLIVGLVVSVFQAATQINEQTLSFLPRLLVTLLAVLFTGPWLLRKLQEFFENLLFEIPNLIG
ncbi:MULTISPECIES: flagellar biosynthesis protein FliQ [Spartinivicinus]|uniref:Flagellar biosynthetic protein FliQ n=1 Tax=Spartinivicinus poritis TaxID=2994640 RepID=A0ABT5U557_9GAMM|nr:MULTISPECIES: flagellar biosynthesis protein FliQ [Spartinivicinus]MDE1461486.1 flagellar biosynthesis protein FliQ [Spartinivicinus sp. A2-2]